ncbi:MAG: DHH family phosphoesterase [Halobacteriales archaeon]|nr:DHH family phosphoesterase [Halobacteriales archaeon]
MEDVLALLSREPRVYLLHKQADADAVGAAVALSQRFPGTIAGHASVGAAATRVAERFGAKVQLDPPLDGYAVGIALDCGSPGMLGALPPGLPLVVIDHHREGGWPQVQARLVEPETTSTCEVVLKLLWALGEGLQPDEALALLCGLVADTQRFRLATKDTLGSAFVLMESGAELPEAIALLEQPAAEERSERIARLRAAQRAEVEEVRGWLVARAQVGSYEASAAQGLVHLGADVAFVAAQRDAEASVSARVRRGVELDLAKVMQRAGRSLGAAWSGGGHAGAAGLTGKGDAARALQACVQALREGA